MHLLKPMLLTMMVIAFAAYAFDCSAMSTPDEAIECCNTMPCSAHNPEHNQECCKTMPSMHAPFLQSASSHSPTLAPVFVAVLPGFNASQILDFPSNALPAHCHAPPIPQAAVPSPLRI
jgi:hypothetical protein